MTETPDLGERLDINALLEAQEAEREAAAREQQRGLARLFKGICGAPTRRERGLL
jgi:hypothetical protein